MKSIDIYIIGICFLVLSIPMYGQTVQSITQGFSVQAYGQMVRWNSNSTFLSGISRNDPGGVGLGIDIRYGITSSVGTYVSYSKVNFNDNDEWEDYKTNVFSAGGLYHFGGSASRFRQYLKAGGTYHNFRLARIYINDGGETIVDNGELNAKGFGLEVGGGLVYYILPELSVELSVTGQFGRYGSNFIDGREFSFDENIDVQYTLIRLGAGYYLY